MGSTVCLEDPHLTEGLESQNQIHNAILRYKTADFFAVLGRSPRMVLIVD